MTRNVFRRMFSLLLAAAMLLGLLPSLGILAESGLIRSALAEESQVSSGSGTWISGKLTYTFVAMSEGSSSNGASGSVSVSGSTMNVKAVSSKFVSSICGGDTPAYPTTTTVTVTNSSSYPLKINTLTSNGVTVTGASQGDTIASGSTFTVIITANPNSPQDTSNRTATGTVSISVSEETTATITAIASAYVSYTLNGHTVQQGGSDVSFTANIGSTISLPAITAPDGYSFGGWSINGIITNDSSFTVANHTTVYPVVIQGELPTGSYFKVGSQTYTFWEAAMSAAVNGSNKKVIVNLDVTLPASIESNLLPASGGTYVKPASDGGVEYIIPSGVTLLVPFDDAGTAYTTTPAVVYGSHSNPTAFKTLTMAAGTSITVQNGGAICVSGKPDISLEGVTFERCSAESGGAISFENVENVGKVSKFDSC
ncbi:MAG: InlB B-repeat-containing protein, partial [Clostridia bacterium]|nr:InlB B-repeat-containing protein [Clostridia bacterium]